MNQVNLLLSSNSRRRNLLRNELRKIFSLFHVKSEEIALRILLVGLFRHTYRLLNQQSYNGAWQLDHIVLDENMHTYIQTEQKLLNKSQLHCLDNFVATLDLQQILVKDEVGTLLQDALNAEERKNFAVNYTSLHASELICKRLPQKDHCMIVDAFAGSGRLILTAMQQLHELQDVAFVLNDIQPKGMLVALCKIMFQLHHHSAPWDFYLSTQNAFTFSIPRKYMKVRKVALSNPPFTRYNRIQNRTVVQERVAGQQQFFRPQMGLHIYSLFLMDTWLQEGDILLQILPAATFHSIYAQGMLQYLLANYAIDAILTKQHGKAFSEKSDVREVILHAVKNQNPRKVAKFGSITERGILKQDIPYTQLLTEWNWTKFLSNEPHDKVTNVLDRHALLRSGDELQLRITRGFEMYGPDFFFLPNKYWEIIRKNKKGIIVQHIATETQIQITMDCLRTALRRPGVYESITPNITHLVLIPDEQNQIPKKYYQLGKHQSALAKRKFGNEWYSHIKRQIFTKGIEGNLFLVDKFAITSAATLLHYFEQKVTASKNFYMVEGSNTKLQAAWMSSILYIYVFLANRREIGGAFGRLQIKDYHISRVFFDVQRLSKMQQDKIITVFDNYRLQNLPTLKQQLLTPARLQYDQLLLEAFLENCSQTLFDDLLTLLNIKKLDFKTIVLALHNYLHHIFEMLDQQSSTKGTRI